MAEATNLLSAFLPKKDAVSKGTATETTKTDLSEDAISEIIRGMMESDSGLASILQGQAGKGLYNSSTSQLLTNDLAARVAGKAALASAPTTRTVSETKKSSPGGVDPKMAAGMKLLEALVGKAFGTAPRNGQSQGQQRGGQPRQNPNGSFQSMLDSVLGRKGKQNENGAFADGGTAFSNLSDSGFNPAGGFDFSAPSLGFTGGGGSGSFGNFNGFDAGGFGGGGFDSFSFGLGGGGYDYSPFSMTGGNNFALGNTGGNSFGGGSGYDFNANDFSSSFGGGSNSFYEPADYSFGSGGSSFWM
jgi:hypothetical protein